MHEFSIMSRVVGAVLEEVGKYDPESVNYVHLEVGELTFLLEDQMRFAYGILSRDNVLAGSELRISFVKPVVRCASCGYEGCLDEAEDAVAGRRYPLFACPECGKGIEVLKGKECTVRDVNMTVGDET